MKYKKIFLKDILEEKGYIRGPFGSALRRAELKSEGIPVYEQQNAIYNHRNFRYFIDEKKFEELRRFQVKTNDLIISCSGTVGRVSQIKENDEKGIISQALLTLRPNVEIVNSDYLYYFFASKEGRNSLLSRSSGSVQVNIAKRNIIENIPLPLPEKKIQKTIVDILNSLDSKIEVNNQIISNLEELASTLFKRWFVDFEFPDENGTPYKSSGGKMVDSELGEIPEGWEVKKVSDIAIINGKNLKKNEYKIINYLDTSNLNKGQIDNLIKFDLSVDKIPSRAKRKVDTKDILFSTVRPNQNHYGIILNSTNSLIASTGFSVLSVNENLASSYVLFLDITQSSRINYYQKIAEGSTSAYPSIKPSVIGDTKIVLAPINVYKESDEFLENIFLNIQSCREENETLEKLRDSLLPKLLSGEIEVIE